MEPIIFASTIVILIFSVIVHEVMHGLVALYFGDETADRAGRLTLNPLPHIDPIGTILLPALGLILGGILFGYAKPVPVNPLNFSNIKWGEFFVSIAGIASNLSLAILFAVLFHLSQVFYPNLIILTIFNQAARINLVLAMFNLIPIPPLDGSKVVMSQLPLSLSRAYQNLDRFGMIILLALLFTPILGIYLNLTAGVLGKLLGL